MRLLNAKTKELTEFISDNDIPPYAILSHTWGKDEVLLQDMSRPGKEFKEGFRKIKYACDQARKDNLSWVWVDTCCIDKSSSAELSEAINSMFAWYKASTVCYAYLSDVVDISHPETLSQQFAKSRWFTRGWTLQELLAPSTVSFYSADWSPLGTRDDLCQQITDITKIDGDFLRGQDLKEASIAKRMSWAALRETSRREDIAYCLLGIFDINMPMLYGEGQKAFMRLQQEIMTSINDYSLFAWGVIDQTGHADQEDEAQSGAHLLTWKRDATPLRGLLATSPRDFAQSGSVVVHKPIMKTLSKLTQPPVSFDGGIHIQLPTLGEWEQDAYWWAGPSILQARRGYIAILGCKPNEKSTEAIGIPLVGWGDNNFGRRDNMVLLNDRIYSPLARRFVRERIQQVFVKLETQPELRSGDIIFRKFSGDCADSVEQDYHSLRAEYSGSDRLLRPILESKNTCLPTSYWRKRGRPDNNTGLAVVFGKHKDNDISFIARPLYVAFAFRDIRNPQGGRSDWVFNRGPVDGKLMGRRVLQGPSDTWVWKVEYGLDTFEITVGYEKREFVQRGRLVWVDVVDLHVKAR